MPRSAHGGRHELGQNFLTHPPTISRITTLVAGTRGPILELGAGDGALTRRLSTLGRRLTAIDIDENRVARLRDLLPGVTVEHADALTHPLAYSVLVGNIPFHLTSPILRRLLTTDSWQVAVILTQWEVARKRAGVGGSTMLTAQTAPWFVFTLRGRVPSSGFTPLPSVDGGIIQIVRRPEPLVPPRQRNGYEGFVRRVFTGRGGRLARIIQKATRADHGKIVRAFREAGIDPLSLPRDLTPDQWALLWTRLRS